MVCISEECSLGTPKSLHLKFRIVALNPTTALGKFSGNATDDGSISKVKKLYSLGFFLAQDNYNNF